MKNKSNAVIVSFIASAYLIMASGSTPCSAQGSSDSPFQIEVKEVSILPHVQARYKTMKLVPVGDYQNWHMDAGSVVSQEVVEVPNHPDSVWIEILALVKNSSASDAKFQFKAPKLELSGGQTIQPWEHLFAGMADYDGLAHVLAGC
jgi:hypothetical protein